MTDSNTNILSCAKRIKFDTNYLVHNAIKRSFAARWEKYCFYLRAVSCLEWQFHNRHIYIESFHDDIIKWKHFPRYWPFVRGIHRSPVNSLHRGQWRGALMFTLICAWINGSVNSREAGDLKRNGAHYDCVLLFDWSQENIYLIFRYKSKTASGEIVIRRTDALLLIMGKQWLWLRSWTLHVMVRILLQVCPS